MNLVDKWQLKASVIALDYDTTSANSGAFNGATILIEKQIGCSLLRLECRHHIAELFIKATSNAIFGPNKSPSVQLFERFKEEFHNLNKNINKLRVWDWPHDRNSFLFQQALEVKKWAMDCL